MGLVGFLCLGVAVLLPGRRARVAQVVLATAAAAAGSLLIATQIALGHFCPYCSVADASGVASAFVAWWRLLGAPEAPSPRGLVYGGAGAIVAAALLPIAVGFALAGRAPEVIRAEVARTLRRCNAPLLSLRTDRDWIADVVRFVASRRRGALAGRT